MKAYTCIHNKGSFTVHADSMFKAMDAAKKQCGIYGFILFALSKSI